MEFGCWNSGNYQAESNYLTKLIAHFTSYTFDEKNCPYHYGQVKPSLKLQGQLIGAMDMLISAHTLALSATLVTNNTADFSRVPGLKTVNWS